MEIYSLFVAPCPASKMAYSCETLQLDLKHVSLITLLAPYVGEVSMRRLNSNDDTLHC